MPIQLRRFAAGWLLVAVVAKTAAAQGPVMPDALPPPGSVVLNPGNHLPPPATAALTPGPALPPPVWSPPEPFQLPPAGPPPLYAPAVVQAQATMPAVPPGTSGFALPDSPGGAAVLLGGRDAPLGTVSGPSPAAGAPTPDMAGQWKNGLFFESAQKDFIAHVGGVFQFDGVWYDAQASQRYPGGVRFEDAVDIRRARLRTEGTMYQSMDYVFEVDFAAGGFNPTGQPATQENTFWTPVPTDMWVQMNEVPVVGTVRIGNQKIPFGLDRLNSARLLNFMERSFLVDASEGSAFNNNRNPGVSVFRTYGEEQRVYTAAGAFKTTRALYGYGVGDGEYTVTGRVTGLPVWNESEKYFIHVGGAMSHRDPVDGATRLRVRPNVRPNPLPLVPIIADTGLIPCENVDEYGIEFAGVYKSFTFQSEYQAYVLNSATNPAIGRNIGNVLFEGWYAEALYFLTGESRPYYRPYAIFARVVPNDPLIFERGKAKGWGAWEVACRVQHLSLNDKSINGGQLNALTLGLNWYWNANTRMQFNYDYTYRNHVPNQPMDLNRDIIHGFGTRMQYDF
jgi:phosphate-selective porin OprO/OprP